MADTDLVDDGLLHGGVDIWSLRDMAKRSAVLQHSLGKPHTTLMLHMTSVNIVPVVGWASVNYDWEDHLSGDGSKYADCSKYPRSVCIPHWMNGNQIWSMDYQDRFGLNGDTAMILAQSVGLQTGTVPYAVGESINCWNNTCDSRPDLVVDNVTKQPVTKQRCTFLI